ncbi:MAG TPA: flagellar FlbD family protein [candidate division Zixibacteria bacterium]|nr:flagellar FlbD family protein [candidate division Zixibacteria bacterium]
MPMIELTRLNRKPIVVNAELIKLVERSPDTVITLITGDKLVVLETVEEVTARVVRYRQLLHPSQSQASVPALCTRTPAGEEQ